MYSFFELLSYSSKRKHQIYEFRKSKLALNSERNFLIFRHFAMIRHDATMNVNSTIRTAWNFAIGRPVSVI